MNCWLGMNVGTDELAVRLFLLEFKTEQGGISHSRLKHFEAQSWSRISSDPTDRSTFFFTASSSVWFRQKCLSGSQNPRRQTFLWIFVSSRDAKGIWYWRFSSFVCSFHNLHSAPLITCFSVLHKTRGARWVKDAPNKWDAILLGQYLNIFCRKAAGLSFVYSLFLISVV